MGTATHKPGTHSTMPGITHPPAVHDPEHDIDARSATIWVIAGSIVLFISLWALLPIFLRVLAEEQARKIDQIPATERTDVMEARIEQVATELEPVETHVKQLRAVGWFIGVCAAAVGVAATLATLLRN